MNRPPDDAPRTDEATVLALHGYFDELQRAQCGFEELWDATGRGGRLPDERELGRLLRGIAGRAQLIELAYVSLRMIRQPPIPEIPEQDPRDTRR